MRVAAPLATPSRRRVFAIGDLGSILTAQLVPPISAERLARSVSHIIFPHNFFDQLRQLAHVHAELVGNAEVNLPRNAAAEENVESLARSQESSHAHSLEADVCGEMLRAPRGASAHVNADAMQGEVALPQLRNELEHAAFSLGNADAAELLAGTGHCVLGERVRVKAQPVRGGIGRSSLLEPRRNVDYGDPLFMRGPQTAVAPLVGKHCQSF